MAETSNAMPGDPPASNETGATTAPTTKPKGERRNSTKFNAAQRIAEKYPDPKTLRGDLDPNSEAALEIASAEENIEERESELNDDRAALRMRKQFAEEIVGLSDLQIVSIRAVLDARTK